MPAELRHLEERKSHWDAVARSGCDAGRLIGSFTGASRRCTGIWCRRGFAFWRWGVRRVTSWPPFAQREG